MLTGVYIAWERELCPAVNFNDFILKLEKFSGAHLIRHMLEAMRKGEEWDSNSESISVASTSALPDQVVDTTNSSTESRNESTTNNNSIEAHLSEEQKERITRSREAALKRQKERQQAPTHSGGEGVEISSDEEFLVVTQPAPIFDGSKTVAASSLKYFNDMYPDDMFFEL